jgi:hypothetical protein
MRFLRIDAMRFLRIDEVRTFVGGGQPHPRLLARLEADLFGEAEPESALEELAIGTDVDG